MAGGASGKVIVCRCEDVTASDLAHAVSLGYLHIEEAKRYTGLGTGPCQGKECMALCAMFLAGEGGVPEAAVSPFTSRPPIQPVALGSLARADEDEDPAP